MFDKSQMDRIVALQQRSFELLQWINREVKNGTLKLDTMHKPMSMSAAAEKWLRDRFHGLPEDVRPPADDIPAFAHLFASYLTTSYTVSGPRLMSDCGCDCPLCTYLISAPHLRPRDPCKKARREAVKLKRILLRQLAEESSVNLTAEQAEALLTERGEIANAISWATYGQELIRRSQFASQGEGVLVLWREISRDKQGRVQKNFNLKAERFIKAEQMVVGAIKASNDHNSAISG